MYEQIMIVLEPFHLFPRIGLWVRSSANISIRPRLKAGEKLPFDRLVLQLQVKHPSTSGLPWGTSRPLDFGGTPKNGGLARRQWVKISSRTGDGMDAMDMTSKKDGFDTLAKQT